MAAEMEFCLLGPLVVRRGTVAVPVPRGKQRAVLAALLLSANKPVQVDDLAEALWGAESPRSARVTVANYVKRLRYAFGDDGRDRIRTMPHGYLMEVNASELDVFRFEATTAAARSAARDGSWTLASERARSALSLWRGEPLGDVESEALAQREIPRLVSMRLQALETRLDADLHVGRHADVIPELQHLADAHPLHENLHALLMLALYRSGRQAEAQAVYRQVRRVLTEDLGTEPGKEIRGLHHRILAADPALTLLVPQPGSRRHLMAVPRELPAAVPHFMGRDGELSALTALTGMAAPGTVVISAIGGTAGVGKTALALHWAHQVADTFPDGQLYVNLRGYDPEQPVAAADVLTGFLRALGVPGADIPAGIDERAAKYRSVLAGRRMLVVLDNAGSAEQVRSLLPGSPGCVAVVTSRDSLPGLVAREGARRLDLDLLPLPDAVNLLRVLIGARVDADPAAAAELAAQCARLPLALRVAAELAAARPGICLADLVNEMADERLRLESLDASGDSRTRIRAVFSWSYHHLGADAARAFRLVGLHPGADFDRYAVAALADAAVEHAGHVLGLLARANLIHAAGPERYGMHDLLRAYARELAAGCDSAGERRAALTRLFDYYVYGASATMDTLFPAERHRRPRIAAPATATPGFTSTARARNWLDAERANLVAVAVRGWPEHATGLAATVFRYLEVGGYFPEATSIFTHARAAARSIGDRAAEGTALLNLGLVSWWYGQRQLTADRFAEALALFAAAGDRTGEARALANLGMIEGLEGRLPEAAERYERALAIFRGIGDKTGEARALGNLGAVEMDRGRLEEAAERHRQALAILRDAGDQTGEAYQLSKLGIIERRSCHPRQAIAYLDHALVLFREAGHRAGQAYTLCALGDVHSLEGRHQEASAHYQQSLDLCRQTGNRNNESAPLNGLGEVFLATGRPEEARAQFAAAASLAAEVGDVHDLAHAHSGLARICHAAGDRDGARNHWKEALALYVAAGAAEADEISDALVQLEGAEHSPPPGAS
jgi:DNA-binding SARP family transcriptional activator/tetratricopeptide (TPR) repeat protein